MDTVVEFFAEIFFEALGEIFVEIFYKLMSLFGRDCKKIKKEKMRTFIVCEMIVILIMFFFGLFLSLANKWANLFWKTVLIISVAVPAIQITVGLILILLKKIRKRNRR